VVKIGNFKIGEHSDCFIVAEIGINHNGDMKIAKALIKMAYDAGCNAVKFQKRTVDVVYTQKELAQERQSPFGTTNGDLKRALEFGEKQYMEIDAFCKNLGIMWFASCWDEGSVDFIEQFDPPCYKISSASLTDDALLKHTKSKGKPVILATGMSTVEQIRHALSILGEENTILCHCTSTYPTENSEINLRAIAAFKSQFSCPVGYSGHEKGVLPSVLAAAYGAVLVERHITLDRTLWGSDHAASLEPQGLGRMVRDIRLIKILNGSGKKVVYNSELPIIEKLRRVGK
jgi:N-acetylneuraminate synthase